jgi:acylphosphatase
MIRARVVVSGRVQGVWYRQTCRDVAVEAGVRGWVRNNPDGTVEAVLEADAAAVERVVAWMREGPARAVVSELHRADEEPAGERGFEVR